MPAHNPYAPSSASLRVGDSPSSGGRIWRDNDRLIVAHGAPFPHRCVKCNEPSVEPHKVRKVYYHHPALYLLLLGYAIIYILVALIVRKRADIDPGLCARHTSRRRLWIAIGWTGALGSIFVLRPLMRFLGMDRGLALGVSILALLAFVVVGISMSRILYAKKIDDGFVRLKGADERFLASVETWLPN